MVSIDGPLALTACADRRATAGLLTNAAIRYVSAATGNSPRLSLVSGSGKSYRLCPPCQTPPWACTPDAMTFMSSFRPAFCSAFMISSFAAVLPFDII